MQKSKNRGFFKSHWRIIAPAIIVVLVAAGFWIWHSHHHKPKIGRTSGGDFVNLDPPTKAEKKETEQHKKDLESQSNNSTDQSSTTSSGKTKATPVITSVNKTEIRGFVQGIIEDGGTCTATLTNGSTTVTKSSTGIADASFTTCQPISLDGSVATGQWTITLSYSSPTAEGSSTAKSYEVQ